MPFLHNIKSVAHYEAITLRRSWFFRLFALGALFILTIFNLIIFSPIGQEDWQASAIASALPHLNLYLLNIGQAIVVIFLASDFLKRDKKLDTNEVLYTRSMSNFEYITGKTWGILRLFLGLNLIVLGIGLIANIIAKGMAIDLMAYISHLLLISIPTIIFSLGLSFVIMSVIRNQAITFLILLGYAALNIFYLYFRVGGIFDYMAFGLPMFKSGVTGYGNLEFLIYHRLIYLLSGLALVLATVLLFKRLPQSKLHMQLTILFLILFAAGSAFSAYKVYSNYSENIISKNRIIELNRIYEDKLFVTVTDATIEVVHNGETISAETSLVFRNDNSEPVENYYFSLNPELTVEKVIYEGRELSFDRDFHIIDINVNKSLPAGNTDSLQIIYSGKILESFCYPYSSNNIRETPYRITLLNIDKRQAFLTSEYVLLTPETHWYPVAGLNYYPNNPARIKLDFTNYNLRVKPMNGLSVISQGVFSTDGDFSVYKADTPVTGITLVIGKYMSDKVTVDSIDYVAYTFPGNDYYKNDLAEISDTLPDLIEGVMRDIENNLSTDYPFSRLSMVEVPIQYFSFPRKNTQTRAEVQPSMILLPEKLAIIEFSDFYSNKKRTKKRMERNNEIITDKELEVRLFNTFVRNTFVSGENYVYTNGVVINEPVRYLLGPSFYFYKNNFTSSEYPVINAAFESYLQKVQTPEEGNTSQILFGGLTRNDYANLILKEKSLKNILSENPGFDTIRNVLGIKGEYLFNLMREKAGISEFNDWFPGYLEKHKFVNVSINQFNADLKQEFGFDLLTSLDGWYEGMEQPGFIFTDLTVSEIVIDGRSRFQVEFVASNPEPVPGVFNISFRSAGSTGQNTEAQPLVQGSGIQTDNIDKVIYLEANQAKQIGIILDAQPREMIVNTLFSKNIPGELNLPFIEVEKTRRGTEQFVGEKVLESIPSLYENNETIVDNEDPGFKASQLSTSSPLKKLLGIENTSGIAYSEISYYRAPENWEPVVLTTYYGKYIRSAVYSQSGAGDRSATWTAEIKNPGYYEISCYIPKRGTTTIVRRGQESEIMEDLHFKVHNDEGIEEITLNFKTAEDGWNNLGSYYLTSDSAKVELTNATTGRMVLGDAIRWVKQN